VAGASSGLGYAVAESLLKEGCHVAVCSRDSERIEAAATSLAVLGPVTPITCDVTNEEQIVEAFARISEVFSGKLNVLVTNAGGPASGFIDDFDSSDWRQALELNLMSTINLARHALPLVRAAGDPPDSHGRIIMITSVSAKQPVPNLYLSNTARAGVQGFCKSLSEELGPTGITVNTVLPGYTVTERLMHLAEATNKQSGRSIEDIYAGWAEDTAVKRLGKPEEFASAVAYIASRQAAYITGLAFPVDGGRVKSLM